MRSSRFLPPPRGAAGTGAPVLCLAATCTADRASELSGAVLARLARSGHRAQTVVLALDGDIDAGCLRAMRALDECLHASGTRLRLVIEASDAARQSPSAGGEPFPSLTIHPSVRSAVLAGYAAIHGPGLVNAEVRAVLSAPAERVLIPARAACEVPAARPEVVPCTE